MQSNINLRAALAETWGIVRANPMQFLLVLLVITIPMLPFDFLQFSEEKLGLTIPLALALPIWIVLGLLLSTGLTLVSIRAAAGEPWTVGHLFAGARWIMRFFGIHVSVMFLLSPCLVAWWLVVYIHFEMMAFESERPLLPSSANATVEPTVNIELTAPGTALVLMLSLAISWIYARFSFAWFLAVDKDMPYLEAEEHSYKMVRGMVTMLTLLQFVFTLKTFLFPFLPISDYLSILLYPVSTVIMSLFTAILYRERLREMEADGGHPLGRRSMLSLPREDDPWEVADEAEVENQQVAD